MFLAAFLTKEPTILEAHPPLALLSLGAKTPGVRGNESLYRGKHRRQLSFYSLESLHTMRNVLRLMLEPRAFYGLP